MLEQIKENKGIIAGVILAIGIMGGSFAIRLPVEDEVDEIKTEASLYRQENELRFRGITTTIGQNAQNSTRTHSMQQMQSIDDKLQWIEDRLGEMRWRIQSEGSLSEDRKMYMDDLRSQRDQLTQVKTRLMRDLRNP